MTNKAMKRIGVLALAAALSPMASAEVTFNAPSGTGFIGRGDVISQVGKAGLVLNPNIGYQDVATYEVECVVANADGSRGGFRRFPYTFLRTQTVVTSVLADARQAKGNGNISGYLLAGYNGVPTPITPLVCAGPDAPVLQPGQIWVLNASTYLSSSGGSLRYNGAQIAY